MQTRIQKWGNSLAVRIPKSFAAETSLEQDTLVELSLLEGKLVIAPIKTRPTLEERMASVTKETLHGEVDFGPPAGKEAW